MAEEAVVMHFQGDPDVLAPRYAEGIRRFQAAHREIQPRSIVLGRGVGELVVMIVWPEGVSHEVLGRFMGENLTDLGLPFPDPRTHLEVEARSWEEIAGLAAPVA